MSKKQKWRVSGYIALSRNRGSVVVCIYDSRGGKTYHVAPIGDVLDCLTGQGTYVKLRNRVS